MARTRKIIVLLATSADGFIARADGSFDFLDRPRPRGNYGMAAFYRSIDTILWGRKTYDVALEYQKKGRAGAGFDTSVKNYVFTRGPVPAEIPPGVEFARTPVREFADSLRARKGKNIWIMGGGNLIASFLDAGEIDEFRVSVIPVLIGEGIPLLAPARRTVPLRLIASKKFPDGVVRLHYAVRRMAPAA